MRARSFSHVGVTVSDFNRAVKFWWDVFGAPLVGELRAILGRIGYWSPKIFAHSAGAKNTTHQCGTIVFGHNPRESVLDQYCRAHDVDNLFVVDASFFPSSAAVNPALTIAAQALRVAEHITDTDLK